MVTVTALASWRNLLRLMGHTVFLAIIFLHEGTRPRNCGPSASYHAPVGSRQGRLPNSPPSSHFPRNRCLAGLAIMGLRFYFIPRARTRHDDPAFPAAVDRPLRRAALADDAGRN